MLKQPSHPNYLPPIDNRLEYVAGVSGSFVPKPVWGAASPRNAADLPLARPWLGADFNYTVVQR